MDVLDPRHRIWNTAWHYQGLVVRVAASVPASIERWELQARKINAPMLKSMDPCHRHYAAQVRCSPVLSSGDCRTINTQNA